MPSAAVSGVQLYCEAHGSGSPLVLLGGLGIDVLEMGMLTGPLAAWFQVIAADNRGTGRSAKPAGPFTGEQMAADVAVLHSCERGGASGVRRHSTDGALGPCPVIFCVGEPVVAGAK